MTNKTVKVNGIYKSTEIGSLNRNIERSVSGVFQGKIGSTSKAIGYAKKRELLLTSRVLNKKIPA